MARLVRNDGGHGRWGAVIQWQWKGGCGCGAVIFSWRLLVVVVGKDLAMALQHFLTLVAGRRQGYL